MFCSTDSVPTKPEALRSSGTIAMPAATRSLTGRVSTGLAVQVDLAGSVRVNAEYGFEQLGPAGAHQSVEPDDLAAGDVERHAIYGVASRSGWHAEVLHRQQRLAALTQRLPRAAQPDRPPVMRSTIHLTSMSLVFASPITRPSRSTVTTSAMRSSSSSRCEM